MFFVYIRCDPEGAPQPKFIWKKDGNRIASGGKYIIDRNGTRLFINRINFEGKNCYILIFLTNKRVILSALHA